MTWIQNVSMSNIKQGFHMDPGSNSMLIQICDPPGNFPVPKYNFTEVHQFQFLDAEHDDDFPDEAKITEQQAAELVRLLQHALEQHMNVIVHCHAGVCRSGAVAEVGVMMGFRDAEAFRSPNLLVKHSMMKQLGWLYDADEKHTTNGETTDWGFVIPKPCEGDI